MRPFPRCRHPIAWVTRRQAGVPAEGRHGMEGAGWLAGRAPGRYTVRRGSGRRQAGHLSLFLMAISGDFRGRRCGDFGGRRHALLNASSPWTGDIRRATRSRHHGHEPVPAHSGRVRGVHRHTDGHQKVMDLRPRRESRVGTNRGSRQDPRTSASLFFVRLQGHCSYGGSPVKLRAKNA